MYHALIHRSFWRFHHGRRSGVLTDISLYLFGDHIFRRVFIHQLLYVVVGSLGIVRLAKCIGKKRDQRITEGVSEHEQRLLFLLIICHQPVVLYLIILSLESVILFKLIIIIPFCFFSGSCRIQHRVQITNIRFGTDHFRRLVYIMSISHAT